VPEGTVDVACGAPACVGYAGYRCSDDGTSAAPDPTACPDDTRHYSNGTGGKSGLYQDTLAFKGSPRNYAVYVPTGYTGDTAVPLVLHFHGWRPAPAGVLNEVSYVWKPTAEASTFIAVAPEGAPCPELNPGGDPYLCFDEISDDAWIQSLIDTLKSRYNVDLDRVYLSGHSGGSFFTQGYGLLHSTQFAAAAVFSGGCISASDQYGNSCSVYDGEAKKAPRKIPYFLVHNPKDQVVPQSYSIAMKGVFDKEGFPTNSHFDPYNGGSNGHSIDNTLVPGVWEWLRAAHHPSMPPAQ
jgi:poly(3-hydroxybutyrate) depolymerase